LGLAFQTFKFCDSTTKVNQGLESQTPPYLPNGDRLGKLFYTTLLKTLENGRVGHLQIPKKKLKIRLKCPFNPKTPNPQYLPNLTLLRKNNTTTSFRTYENGGVGHLETFKFINN
jgi:hypothetical protein